MKFPKRLISWVMSLAMLFSFSTIFNSSAQAVSYSPYKRIIERAIKEQKNAVKKQPKANLSAGKGFLCDFDGNGVKELVITFWEWDGCCTDFRYAQVYTIKDGKAVLVKSFEIEDDLGGYSYVGTAKKNGKKYLFISKGTQFYHHFEGSVKFYGINGTEISCKSKGSYSKAYSSKAKKYKTVYKINGKKSSRKKFISWQTSFKLGKLKRTKSKVSENGFTYNSTAKSLKTILKQIS